jgi:thiol-disulfide isomerase/thioredoxin
MSVHNTLAALLCFILYQSAQAKLPKDLLKNITNSSSEFRYYEIRFERQFKYPKETDTLSEVFNSTVYYTSDHHYIGHHRIDYLRSQSVRSLLASNATGLYRVNFNDNMYFYTLKDEESLLKSNLEQNIYQPFLFDENYWNSFDVKDKNKEFYYLEKIDTIKDEKQRVMYVQTESVSIDRNTYLPMEYTSVSVNSMNTQFSRYKLNSYSILNKKSKAYISAYSDSLVLIIKSYTDGDSLKKSKRDLYKKLKVGDPAAMITGTALNGLKLQASDLKDSVVILDFFYSTCAPCIKAVPELNRLYSKFKGKGVKVFGVNPFESDWDNLSRYISDYNVVFPILKTEKQSVYDYGVTGFPRTFIIKNGKIVKIYYGFSKGMDQQIIQVLNQLIASP